MTAARDSDHVEIPPRPAHKWHAIEGTYAGYADPFVVNSIALPNSSSMVDLMICYPVSTIDIQTRVNRAVRIDLHHTYFQSFSSDVGSYLTEADDCELWSLSVTDQSDLKTEFISKIMEWAPPSSLPPPSEHLRHFALGRDHHGYMHFLAVDAAVRFFEVDWTPIDKPYNRYARYAERLTQQHARSQFLADRAVELGPGPWADQEAAPHNNGQAGG